MHPSRELAKAAWLSIARRSRAGLLGYPLIFGLLTPAMSLGARGTPVYLAGAALLLGVTVLRAYLILRFHPLYETHPGRWRMLYTSSLMLLVLLLAGQVCSILVAHGPGPWSYFAVTWKGLEINRLLTLRATELEKTQDELRRRAEELRLAKEAAERADLAKTEFLANMSHEIKSGLEGRQRDYATLVQSASESLLRLIDDILDFEDRGGQARPGESPLRAPRPDGVRSAISCGFAPRRKGSLSGSRLRMRSRRGWSATPPGCDRSCST